MMKTLPPNYQSLSGAEKLELIWKNIVATEYPKGALPSAEPSLFSRLPLFLVRYLRASIEHESDELPPGRVKVIHRHGSVARVRFEATSTRPYTGLLRGSHEGLLRFSAAVVKPSFSPALALKLFVDGRPSVNIFAMHKIDGQGKSHDVFAIPYSNAAIPAVLFPGTMIGRAFQRTAEALRGARLYGAYLPLHDAAGFEADGKVVQAPVVPDRLIFTPLLKDHPDPNLDWRLKLGELAENTPLFDIQVAGSIDTEPEPLGRLTLLSRFVASKYSDDVLFFQHHRGPLKTDSAAGK